MVLKASSASITCVAIYLWLNTYEISGAFLLENWSLNMTRILCEQVAVRRKQKRNFAKSAANSKCFRVVPDFGTISSFRGKGALFTMERRKTPRHTFSICGEDEIFGRLLFHLGFRIWTRLRCWTETEIWRLDYSKPASVLVSRQS